MPVLPHMKFTPPVDEQKARMRKQAVTRRARLAAEYNASLRRNETGLARFAASLIDQFYPSVVAGYWPMQSEIDVLPLLSELQNKGVRLCLPITGPAGSPLSFHYWAFGTVLDTGRFGIQQPFPDTEQLLPDVICVPLLAFDSKFQRLGYGGGYYDKSIIDLKKHFKKEKKFFITIGLAYSIQEEKKIPKEKHDMKLDYIITEKEVLSNFNQKKY